MNFRSNYAQLGDAIATARKAAGVGAQRDLAARLGVTQQSVSRWEAGTHRPNLDQLVALAETLRLNPANLRLLAQYDQPAPRTFMNPFPVDLLGEVEFEQFVAELATSLHPGGVVKRAGGRGHDQQGLDVDIHRSEGERIIIQCKRTQRFGPADFAAMAAEVEVEADRKILALSRVASPQTEAAARGAGWMLWDKDYMSRQVRGLPVEHQERLVDLFFRGQREALLGRPEPGPWMTADEFFRPFELKGRAFTHAWALAGREVELEALIAAMAAPEATLTVLCAAGGMGKSRLLLEAVRQIEAVSDLPVRFLSGADNPTRSALDTLPKGPHIVVVDDAHDRDGLGVLFERAADETRQMRLVLATRPYARDRLCREAAVFGLAEPHALDLPALSKPKLIDLATEVLLQFDGDPDWAEHVVARTGGSPLVTAMAARVVARERLDVELAKSEKALRSVILGKFEKVITGDLGQRGEEALHRDVMHLLALVQPFNPNDKNLLDLLEAVQGIKPEASSRAMRNLLEGGVAFRRAGACRLMPDVLGDYLIDTTCLDDTGQLSFFARRVLDQVSSGMLTNVLVNLGRLDWRMHDGDPSESQLLDSVWRSLDTIEAEWDPRLNAVRAAALYQPGKALDFVTRQLQRGRRLRELPDILKAVAYGSGDLRQVAPLLWAMGKDDPAELGPNPGHALRVLVDLSGYDPRRGMTFSNQALEFGLALMDDPTAWDAPHMPLRVIEPLLSVEGMTTEAVGQHFSMTPFFINMEVVRPLRAKIIEKVIALLSDTRLNVAYAAASFLPNALRSPIGMLGASPPEDGHAVHDPEFVDTLRRLEAKVRQGLPPLVGVAIDRAVSWQARHGAPSVARAAQAVRTALPDDLEFQVRDAIEDGASDRFLDEDNDRWQRRQDRWLKTLTTQLRAKYNQPEALRAYLETVFAEFKSARAGSGSAYMLVHGLLADDRALAERLIEDGLERPGSGTIGFASNALSFLLRDDRGNGRAWARRMLQSDDPLMAIRVASAFHGERDLDDDDLVILRGLLKADDNQVICRAIDALSWSDLPADAKLDLLLEVPARPDKHLGARLARAIAGGSDEKLAPFVTPEQAVRLLAKFETIEQFDTTWTDRLLAVFSLQFPHETAGLLKARVEEAARRNDYGFRAANHGPYLHHRPRFVETPAGVEALKGLWTWLKSANHENDLYQRAALQVFQYAMLHDGPFVADFLGAELDLADVDTLWAMSALVRHAHHSFAFNQADFVVRFLERCRQVDLELAEGATDRLFAMAVSGVRSGVAGEPMPRDVADRDKAIAMLSRLSRLSPAYRLYDEVRRSAEASIAYAHRQAEAMSEE